MGEKLHDIGSHRGLLDVVEIKGKIAFKAIVCIKELYKADRYQSLKWERRILNHTDVINAHNVSENSTPQERAKCSNNLS